MIKTESFPDMLEKAGQRISRILKEETPVQRKLRPVFHLSNPAGWINDPNGFSLFKGKYHLFAQHNPYSTYWGAMHWAHFTTEDFIHWKTEPEALAPDHDYDRGGCFSGTAMDDDGKHVLLYTGVTENGQAQCLAIGNGTEYGKAVQNPVITSDQLPVGSSRKDFRDPKLWKDGTTYFALMGSKTFAEKKSYGQVVLYSSKNLTTWKFENILASSRDLYGYGEMWECPDFFRLGERSILIVSPQFMEAHGNLYHGGNNTICLIGNYNRTKYRLENYIIVPFEYGLDFYAPQTICSADGRRIAVGWLQSWDNRLTPDSFLWSGIMSIPRELTLRNGKLYQNPVRELERFRTGPLCRQGSCSDGELVSFNGISGRCIDMTVDVEAGRYNVFEIRFACDEHHYTSIQYDRRTGLCTFNRLFSGVRRDFISTRAFPVSDKNGRIRFRILLDVWTAELFVNDGEQAFSSLIYTDLTADGVEFLQSGSKTPVNFSVEKFTVSL
ncbi:MAG: GH32 C-terminal domain-containing protein [Treponema sp.]|jgi:beta-fructofuranosidase|nr:GH32 C-terminal domain-containing protein [Treponema sp.]